MLWIISHPERVDRSELDAYDIIAVASSSDAERLAEETGRPVHFLPQAADADTFRLGFLDPALRDDVIYVGSARQPRRRGPRWLTDLEIPFKLFGQNWDEPPEADHVVEEFVPNRRLASLYRSAAVVVNDHHDAMRTAGYVSNRVFDVLAAGGLVVSDDVEGLHEILGDAVPTYRDAEQLRLCVGGFVADPGERSRRARSGRSIVIDAHTLDHRAEHFLSLISAYSQTYADT